MAKKRKITRYVPPPQPVYSPEEAKLLEEDLRRQIDSWAVLQTPRKAEMPKDQFWANEKPPGIQSNKSRREKLIGEIDKRLFPKYYRLKEKI